MDADNLFVVKNRIGDLVEFNLDSVGDMWIEYEADDGWTATIINRDDISRLIAWLRDKGY